MAQAGRTGKADDQALRSEIEALRRSSLPISRKEIAERYGVSTGTVQAVRAQVDRELAAELPLNGPAPGRTVEEFDGRRLFELRRARDLMQDELGRRAVETSDPEPRRGVSRGEIGHLERTHRRPTLRTLRRLAVALGVQTSDLLRLPYRLDVPARDLLVLRDREAQQAESESSERAPA